MPSYDEIRVENSDIRLQREMNRVFFLSVHCSWYVGRSNADALGCFRWQSGALVDGKCGPLWVGEMQALVFKEAFLTDASLLSLSADGTP